MTVSLLISASRGATFSESLGNPRATDERRCSNICEGTTSTSITSFLPAVGQRTIVGHEIARGPLSARNSSGDFNPMHKVFIEGGLIRKLASVEMDAYRDHLLRLDAESRHNRFGAAIADDMIRTYAATARGSDVIVHGFFVDGVLRGAADLRMHGPLYRREAEAAFSIEKPWQSHGVGAALLERSLLAARNRGIQLLHVCCLFENQRMQQLARKFEAELSFDFGTVIGKVENPYPTPLSVMQELVVDGQSFAAAYVDFQSRLLMPA